MPKIKWTLEKLKEEALKYKTRTEFYKNSSGAYTTALNRNLLDQICQHMPMPGARLYSFEGIHKLALYCKTKKEFRKKYPKHYKAVYKMGILEKVTSHMVLLRIKRTKENLIAEALKYDSKIEFRSKNPAAYSAAHKMKIIDEICQHMIPLTRKPWTKEEVKIIALKYDTKKEFVDKECGAYSFILKNNILEECCSHMKQKHLWTNIELQQEALKYKNRSEFKKNNPRAYGAACSRSILDQICKHMIKSQNTSFLEMDLFNIIKSKYPKTQKLRDRKVKIKNKSYIQGFELDIYIPELRKAIEFDGDYWHSVEGLKRSRSHWPEEDLINYHQIKDDYFKSKGIEILHISEEEWKKNKEKILNRCFSFLES